MASARQRLSVKIVSQVWSVCAPLGYSFPMSAAKRPVVRLTRWMAEQAKHRTHIDLIIFAAWRGIVKDVLDVQASCWTLEDEWPVHSATLPHRNPLRFVPDQRREARQCSQLNICSHGRRL
jgi:hypothetical protein